MTIRSPEHRGSADSAAGAGPVSHVPSNGSAGVTTTRDDWLAIDMSTTPMRRAVEVLADKWILVIVRDAVLGITRFDDFARHEGLSAPTLSDRLRRLVAAGILSSRPYREPRQRTRSEYVLTNKGAELLVPILAIMQWGERYLPADGGPAVTVRHPQCGGPVRVVSVCSCGRTHEPEVLTAAEIRAEPGPGARLYTPTD